MLRCRLIILVLGIVFLTAGCASIYRVEVTGYADPAHKHALVPGKTISVLPNPQASNPLLEKEVALKIAKLLQKEGYEVVEEGKADFHLTFEYGMERGPVLTESVRRPRRIDVYDPDTGKTHYTTVDTYQPYSVLSFTRSLSVRVRDMQRKKTGVEKQIVWAADSISEGTSSDLRQTLNYLLVATFQFFGQDTSKAVTVTLKEGDLQVKHVDER